jgi:hypothetical protein
LQSSHWLLLLLMLAAVQPLAPALSMLLLMLAAVQPLAAALFALQDLSAADCSSADGHWLQFSH